MPNPVARAKRKHPNLELIEVGVFALLLLVVCAQTFYLLTYVRQQRQVSEQVACQVQVNSVFREALTLRTDAGTRERQAQREFLAAVLDGVTADELATYNRALDEADRDRAYAPLPSVPRC